MDRARIAAFVGILAGLNAVSPNAIGAYREQGLIYAFVMFGGVSAAVWFALAGCFLISREAGPPERARRADWLVAGLIACATLVPSPDLAAASVLAGGTWFVLTSAAPSGFGSSAAGTSRTRRIGIVLVAVSGTLFIGRLMLRLFAPSILPIDGQIVAALAQTSVHGNVVAFSNGQFFVVGSGCSSIHNLTFALLVWATMTQLLRLPITPRLLFFGLLAVLVTVTINIVRLVAIALLPEHFEFLHVGDGAAMFGWLTLIAAMGIVFVGAYGEKRPAI